MAEMIPNAEVNVNIDYSGHDDIMGYIASEQLLLELYQKESIIRNCVSGAIANNWTVEQMLLLMIMSLCELKNNLFAEMVKMVQRGESNIT